MKKMMFILMIMTALLASTTFADAPADITNPSFENDTAGVCDAWTLAGAPTTGIEYITGDPANAYDGDDFFKIREDGGWAVLHTDVGQDVAVTAGGQAEMLCYAKSEDGSAITNGMALKFEWYTDAGLGWDDGTQEFAELNCDLTGDWQLFSLVADVPATMNFARATLVARNNGVGKAACVDLVWIGVPGEFAGGGTPTSPDPGNGSIQSTKNAPAYGYEPVTTLSWINPDAAEDSIYAGLPVPNDFLGVEVKWGVGLIDPNFAGSVLSHSVAKGTGNAFESAALDTDLGVTLPLPDDSVYYWQVIITDANSAGDQVAEGNVWSFETGDAEPNMLAPAGAYMWVAQDDGDGDSTVRTFTVTSTYSDDGESAFAEEPNFVTGDWLYPAEAGVRLVSSTHTADADGPEGVKSGTVTAEYETVVAPETPETQIPGYWNFGLQIIDATDRVNAGPTGYYYVGETCAQAAAEGGDTAYEDLVGAYDVNDDCVNNLVDFASFAAEWLDVSPLKE